ncbi:MAG TPA: prephenate dehydrogenase [Dyella sp.]
MKESPFPTVTLIGHGPVGRMFGDLLHDHGSRVMRFDRVPAPGVLEGDARIPDETLLESVRRSDLLLLALPEPVLADALKTLASHMPPHALLVETASVKTCLEPIKQAQLAGREILGINPMFAPSLAMKGRSVAVIRQHYGKASECFESILEKAGAVLVDMSAGYHDRIAANTQALTHATILAFAEALRQSGYSLTEILAVAPPPFRVLAALVARMLGQNSNVYLDIQSENPYAADARRRLIEGISHCSAQSTATDTRAFALWFEDISGYFGPEQRDLGELCASLFANIPLVDIARDNPATNNISIQTSVPEGIS